MKPAPFDYVRAESVGHVLSILAEYGPEARVLAGGQSLIPLMNRRLVRPAVLVAVQHLASLRKVECDGVVTLGPAVLQRDAQRLEEINGSAPLLSRAIAYVGNVATRSRGTVGGSVAFADPAGEIPAVMVAYDANFELQSDKGQRIVPAAEFFVDEFATVMRADELLTSIQLRPDVAHRRGAFLEVARRRGGSRSIVGVALTLELNHGVCSHATLALAGVGATPVRAHDAEALMRGATLSSELPTEVADAATASLEPPSDAQASAQARRTMARALVTRAIQHAWGET